MNSPNRRTPVYALLTLCIVLGLIELISFIGVRILSWRKSEIFLSPPVVGTIAYENYLLKRDSLLGWPSPAKFGDDFYDAVGSRMIPSYPDPFKDTALISLYGDSYTEGAEADSAQAWSNQLSILIKGRVANFGVGGFGSDQAFIRFQHNRRDNAKIVFLNHMSDDGFRNANQWRYLLSGSHEEALGFKPRFVAQGDSLRIIPLPTLTYDECIECGINPAKYLRHEFFIPDDGQSGIQTARFPHTLTLLRTFDNFIVKPKIGKVPRHMYHYKRDHPSGILQLTRLILREFSREATRRGRIPIVTIIPDGKDLEHFINHNEWTYQLLMDDLRSDGVDVFNFGTGILKKLNGRNPCTVINDCYNHPNAEGYKMIAEVAYEHLKEKNLLKEIGR